MYNLKIFVYSSNGESFEGNCIYKENLKILKLIKKIIEWLLFNNESGY